MVRYSRRDELNLAESARVENVIALLEVHMAHKKGVGSSKNGRDSNAQRRGTKVFDGQIVTAGSILVRQCGSPIKPGMNVALGTDFTLFAKIAGKVKYERVGKTGKRVSVYQ